MVRSLLLTVLVAGLFGPTAVEAQAPAAAPPSPFQVELQAATGYRGPAIEGYLYSSLPWRISNVRMRVESVDAGGQVTGEAYGWVQGNVPAGGRAYFFVPVSTRGATYRATVESFDKVSIEVP